MDQKLDILEKKVLVGIVKMVQKQGMQGTAGGWKDFLNSYDKKFGSSLSDPAKRSNDVLVSFLKTFTKGDDLKFIAKVLQHHRNRDILELYEKKSPDDESPEQRLVRLTLQHPQYALNYMFPSCNEEWVITKLGDKSKVMTSNTMYAVDCEMVLCEDGSEALVRVCVVDRNLEVKLDELVNPNKAVADYRSEITGVTAEDLVGVTCSLADIQRRMEKLLSHGNILVGHSLNNDLNALKVDHPRVIDTSLIFKYSNGNRRPSLNNLCKSVLGYEIRKSGAPHDCLDDACAPMKLVLAVIEHGFDNTMPIVQDVPEIDKAKLFIHRIPFSVPSEELHSVIPGDFTIEVKTSKRQQGDKYAAVAIFSSPQEACQAFENVEGSLDKDSSGRQQKLVKFQTSKGVTWGIYVRKMACDALPGQVLVKRAPEGEENTGLSKKRKIELINEEIMSGLDECKCKEHIKEIERLRKMANSNQCKDHLREIERLKQELIEKDFQISKQHKMISVLEEKLQRKKDKKNKGR